MKEKTHMGRITEEVHGRFRGGIKSDWRDGEREREAEYMILFSGKSQCILPKKKIKEKENCKLSQYLNVSPKPA